MTSRKAPPQPDARRISGAKSSLHVSAKLTIRETDGTEYQLKARIGQMVVNAGYARKVRRGLLAMINVSLPYALRIIELSTDCDSGKLLPEGPPSSLNLTYPVTDMRSNPEPFGSKQNWATFP